MVVALCDDPESRARLSAALAAHYRLEFATQGPPHQNGDRYHQASVVILELVPQRPASAAIVAHVRRAAPEATVIAYAHLNPATARQLLEVGRAGAHELVLFGVDDSPQLLRETVASALRHTEVTRVADRMARCVPDRERPIIYTVVRSLRHVRSVEDVARLLDVPRRTVSYQLQRASLPPLQELIAWGRIVLAVHLRNAYRLSGESIAARLGLSSEAALRNLVRRHARASMREIEALGLDGAVEAFQRRLSS